MDEVTRITREASGLLNALSLAGCHPRPNGDGRWIALCPTCLVGGHRVLAEISASGVIACSGGHEALEPGDEAA